MITYYINNRNINNIDNDELSNILEYYNSYKIELNDQGIDEKCILDWIKNNYSESIVLSIDYQNYSILDKNFNKIKDGFVIKIRYDNYDFHLYNNIYGLITLNKECINLDLKQIIRDLKISKIFSN